MSISSLLTLTASMAMAFGALRFWDFEFDPEHQSVANVVAVMILFESIWLVLNGVGIWLCSSNRESQRNVAARLIVAFGFLALIGLQAIFALRVISEVGVAIA